MGSDQSRDVYLASGKGHFVKNDFKRNSSFDARDHALEYFRNHNDQITQSQRFLSNHGSVIQ